MPSMGYTFYGCTIGSAAPPAPGGRRRNRSKAKAARSARKRNR